ncbi:O52N5 protein, partial [Amia calva]|nr:O52N5 protein [Amia calva]
LFSINFLCHLQWTAEELVMSEANGTQIKEFIIMGFPGLLPQYYSLVPAFLFLVYIAIITGNVIIIVVVTFDKSLHKPTYFIFCNLAVADLSFSSTTLPRIIARYWFDAQTISFSACFLQMFLVHYLGSVNSFLLLVMAIDRYVAICNPLRYPALVKNTTVHVMCAFSWLITIILMGITALRAVFLPFCGPNIIKHCYCDHIGITRLACTNIASYSLGAFIIAMIVLLVPLFFIIFSYIQIIISVTKITSSEGRYKAFSTCSSQLFIIALYYLPRCFVYLANVVGITISPDFRIVLILVYSLLPAMVNPLIYCFKTKEIKDSLIKRFRVKKVENQARNVICVHH